jgi:hypothetical protein
VSLEIASHPDLGETRVAGGVRVLGRVHGRIRKEEPELDRLAIDVRSKALVHQPILRGAGALSAVYASRAVSLSGKILRKDD